MKGKDLTGQRFGRLTVMYRVPKPEGYTRSDAWWHCKCDCGKEVDRSANNLVYKQTKSCGCLAHDVHVALGKARKQSTENKNAEKLNVKNLTLESVCPECGKVFERISTEWGYMIGEKKYCTYKCMRAAEQKAPAKKRRMPRGRKIKEA